MVKTDFDMSVTVHVDGKEKLREIRDLLEEINELAEETEHRLANAEPAQQPDEDGGTDE
jgi:hypothetical protein